MENHINDLKQKLSRLYTENSQLIYNINLHQEFTYQRVKVDPNSSSLNNSDTQEDTLNNLVQSLQAEHSLLKQQQAALRQQKRKLNIVIPQQHAVVKSNQKHTDGGYKATQIWHQYDFLLGKQTKIGEEADENLNDRLDGLQQKIAFVRNQLSSSLTYENLSQQKTREKTLDPDPGMFRNKNLLQVIDQLQMRIEDLEIQLQRINTETQILYENSVIKISLQFKVPPHMNDNTTNYLSLINRWKEQLVGILTPQASYTGRNSRYEQEVPQYNGLRESIRDRLINQELDVASLKTSTIGNVSLCAVKMNSKLDALQRCFDSDKQIKNRRRSVSKARWNKDRTQTFEDVPHENNTIRN